MGESVTFTASRKNAIGFALLLLALTIFLPWTSMGSSVLGWVLIVFFGLCTAYYAVSVLKPDAVYLRLDDECLEIGTVLGKQRIKWSEMQDLQLATTAKGYRVLKIFHSPANTKPRVSTIDAEYAAPLTEILSTLQSWRDRCNASR